MKFKNETKNQVLHKTLLKNFVDIFLINDFKIISG